MFQRNYLLLATCLLAANLLLAQGAPTFEPVSTVRTGGFDESAAEILAFDPTSAQVFVTNAESNTIEVLSLSAAGLLQPAFSIDLSPYGGGVNSVDVANGLVAVAVEADPKTDPGQVVLFASDGTFQTTYPAGALPDAVAFSPDGRFLAVANEGEPNDDYTIDPEGSITLIDLTASTAQQIDFGTLIGQESALRNQGIRIFGPGANAAQDLEPEYVAFSPDGQTVYVTLQENNALAICDVATASLTGVEPLGYKDHAGRTPQGKLQGFDASNRVDDIRIWEHPVLGMYQPDAIKAYQTNGATFLVTANEGDARDYDGYSEETRVEDLTLDPTAYPSAYLQSDESLGRLKTTEALGDADGDGDVDQIYAYGARSFSIWDASGTLVYDSGDEFERTLANLRNEVFNSTNDDNDSRKNRSDDKGPEPEAIEIGQLNGRTYAFIGLERQSGIMVYDVTEPTAAEFITYFDNRDYSQAAGAGTGGDLGPEDIVFVEPARSPTGQPMLLVSNEVSGTVTAYRIFGQEERFTLQILHNNDGESELLRDPNVGVGGISAFASTLDSLRYVGFLRGDATVLLSSGDNFLPGPVFSAGLTNKELYDAVAVRALNYDALAIGNHDFDFGPDVLARFVEEVTNEGDPATFLSANLDVSQEPSLQALAASGRIAPSTILYRGEERIGVIGLTTTELPFISSPGAVNVSDLLADAVNDEVAALQGRGINKFILISHLQGINQDTALIPQLRGIDVVIAGGGDELLTNNPADTLLGLGVGGPYPLRLRDADNREVMVVTTPGSYRYAGQLFVTFDDAGEVLRVGNGSGPVKVNTERRTFGVFNDIERDIEDYIASLNARSLASTEVDLNGIRGDLRTKETNQGNLIADALLWQARQEAANFGVRTPQIALQNGGGIRNDAILPAGSNLTELTTFDMLPFSNFVSVVEQVSALQLKSILENAVSRVQDVSGRFAQVAGFSFDYDPARTAQVLDAAGAITTPGDRVRRVTLSDGTILVQDGMVLPNSPAVDVATVNFLVRGGDQYPFNSNFTNLGVTYQQALANYLTQALNGNVTAVDYPEGGEGRITTSAALTPLRFSAKPAADFDVFPNPAQNWVAVNGTQKLDGDRTYTLVDSQGRLVLRRSVFAEAGLYEERLNLNSLPKATYSLRVEMPSRILVEQIVVR